MHVPGALQRRHEVGRDCGHSGIGRDCPGFNPQGAPERRRVWAFAFAGHILVELFSFFLLFPNFFFNRGHYLPPFSRNAVAGGTLGESGSSSRAIFVIYFEELVTMSLTVASAMAVL